MGDRYVQSTSGIQSDENTKLLYTDENKLYGWAMSQYLPTGDFKKIKFSENDDDLVLIDEIKEDIINTPDDNDYGYFIESAL